MVADSDHTKVLRKPKADKVKTHPKKLKEKKPVDFAKQAVPKARRAYVLLDVAVD